MPWKLVSDDTQGQQESGGWKLAPDEPDTLTPETPDLATTARMKQVEGTPLSNEEMAARRKEFGYPTGIGAGIVPSALRPDTPIEENIPQVAVQEGKSLLGGAMGGTSQIFGALGKGADFAANILAKIQGKEPDTLRKSIFTTISQNQQYYADKLKEGGMKGLVGDLLTSAGAAAPDVMAMGALGPYGMPIYGGAMGAAQGGVQGGLMGAAQGALMKGALGSLSTLPKFQQVMLSGIAGGAVTPGDAQEKMKGALTWGALGALGPSGKDRFGDLAGEALSKMGLYQTPEMGIVSPESKILNKVMDKIVSPEKREAVYQKYVNQYASLENLKRKAVALGFVPKPGEDPQFLMRSYLGNKGKVDAVIDNGTYTTDANGNFNVTGEGLTPAIKDFENQISDIEKDPDVQRKDWNKYVEAKRTLEDLYEIPVENLDPNQPMLQFGETPKFRRMVDGEPIVSDEQAEVAKGNLAELQQKYGDKFSVFDATAPRVYDFQHRVLQMGADAGLYSQDTVNKWITQNPHYVPFDRVLSEVEQDAGRPTPDPMNKTVADLPTRKTNLPIKQILGSGKEIEDSLGSIYKHTFQIMDSTDRNKIARSIVGLSDKLPDEINKASGPGPLTIKYYENGEAKYAHVTQNVYDAMQSLNSVQAQGFLPKIISVPTHWLRLGATMTPEFSIRNPIRDQFDAYVFDKFGFRPFIDLPGAISDILGDKNIYDDYIRSGSAYSGVVQYSRDELARVYRNITKDPSKIRYLNPITDAQDLSELLEKATRVAAFKAARNKGLSPLEAGFHAAEATVDFRLRPASRGMRSVNQAVAFFNAGVQGTDRMLRAFRDDKLGFTLKAIASITAPSLALYLVNKDDPNYQELPAYDRYLFWHVPNGDGTFIRIPKPFLLGQIFGSMPEGLLEYARTKNPKQLENVAAQLYEAASPWSGDPVSGLVPTALKALVENASPQGWNFFKKRPIVPAGKESLPEEEQYTPYTTETAKLMGKAISKLPRPYMVSGILPASPAKIENMVQELTGGSGRYALQAGDLAIKGVNALLGKKGPDVGKRPTELADYPLLRGFVTRPIYSMQTESLQEFYDNLNKAKAWETALNSYGKVGNVQKIQEIIKDHPEFKLASSFESAQRDIADNRKSMEAVATSKELSSDQKRQILTTMAWQSIKIAKIMNAQMEQKQ